MKRCKVTTATDFDNFTKGTCEQMKFTAEDRAKIECGCEYTRSRAKQILENPELVQLVPGEQPHIWKLFERWVTMSDEALMQEEEADYVLFGCVADLILKSEWNSPDARYTWMRDWLNGIYERPEDILLVPGEDPHIWERLNALYKMSREELMTELEAGALLDSLTSPPAETPHTTRQ